MVIEWDGIGHGAALAGVGVDEGPKLVGGARGTAFYFARVLRTATGWACAQQIAQAVDAALGGHAVVGGLAHGVPGDFEGVELIGEVDGLDQFAAEAEGSEGKGSAVLKGVASGDESGFGGKVESEGVTG